MATTSISLIREQSERIRPPRALWVPFALGRPLGSAADPEFQKNVIRAAFDLLGTATQPTIADWDGAEPDEAGPEAWACPLNLAPATDDSLSGRLLAEIARLRPWSAETRHERGRTLFGASGATPDRVDDVALALATIAETGDVSSVPDIESRSADGERPEWAFDMPLLIRHLADDLRTFYHEAIAAQPGPSAPNHDALNDWIFGGTALGETLIAVADALTTVADENPMARLVRGLTIPEGRYQGGSAF